MENQVYNGDFLLAQEETADFPDGWQRTGGDSTTSWKWLGPAEGPRAIAIDHPSGPRAGIIQPIDTTIPAGEIQRWQVEVVLQTEPAGVLSYLIKGLFRRNQPSALFSQAGDCTRSF